MTSKPSTRSRFSALTTPVRPGGLAVPAALRRHAPLLVLLGLGLLLRLWFVWVTPLDPAFSSADDGDYYRRALRLATTGVYLDDFWLIRPPGTIFFFAGLLRVALLLGLPAYGLLLIQLTQVVLGTLTVLLGYDLARRIFSQRAGLAFAALLALWYSFVELPSVLFTELLYTFLFTLHFWLLARFDAGYRVRGTGYRGSAALGWLAAAGLVLGAAALVRSPALYSLVFVAIWLFVREWLPRATLANLSASVAHSGALPGARSAGAEAAPMPVLSLVAPARMRAAVRAMSVPLLVFTACTLAVVGPWTLRNYLVYERFIAVDTLGPINLWLDLGSPDDRNDKIKELLLLPQADRQAYASAQLRTELDGRYWLLFKDAWENFRHVWKAQFTEDFFVKSSFFSRPLRETWPLGVAGDLIWLVFTLAGLAGLAAPPREGWHYRLFVLAWLAYSFLTIFLFHVEPRYLLPIFFLLGLYGASALAEPQALLAGLRRFLPSGLLAALLVLAALMLIVTYRDYPRVLAAGVARERAIRAGDQAYFSGDYALAEQAYRAALAAQPYSYDVRTSLALAIAAQGRDNEAWQLVENGGPRRTDLVAGHLARTLGKEDTARFLLDRVEYTAGEDAQSWALTWLRPEPLNRLQLGDNLDLGYLSGFAPGEEGAGFSFRWLEGQGRIVLPLAAPLEPGDTVLLRMAGGLPGTTPLEARFADGTLVTLPVQQGTWRVYRLPLPPSQVGVRRLELALRAPTFVPALENPASDDTRTLSLMISDVAVR